MYWPNNPSRTSYHVTFALIRQKRKPMAGVILSTYKRIIVAVSEQRLASYQPSLRSLLLKVRLIYLFFTPGR